MKQSLFIFLVLVLIGAVLFTYWFSGGNSNHVVFNTSTGIPVSNNSSKPHIGNNVSNTSPASKFSTPLCPQSIWGYGYVYPNETLTLLVYPNINYLKNGTFIILSLADNFTSSYSVPEALSMTSSSGIAGRVPLPLYFRFQTPGKQFSITGNALLLQLWKGESIVNESRTSVWLHFQVAPIKHEDVHLKFGRYSSLYTSFKKGLDTFEYTVTITNLYNKNKSIILENVSFPLATLQKYPKPPSIKITSFRLADIATNKTVTEILPNSTAVLRVLIAVPSSVDGLYFKPKLVFKIGNESLAVPAPPMEYVRVVNCG
ncbi:hypothetical protein X802_05325 [Thermococcus guaymasensis DSM 11113]|uniref:Uncharacterized protein n=1 Tax=Thermococcus guaymasensis DSM 11113 TaxID=1432656 RepID=A0A0X1KNA2_9EURY|nr:hypothetical protein [Thermococcus guaymasensis]AJC72718.1 hypothetical protein X802_05325 [Thermococcus guaymasensis DSM 11113]